MSKTRIEGSFVATVTPFDRRGEIDFGAWQALLDHQQRHGTRAILFMGSTGEPSLLSPEEKKRIIVETVKMRTGGMAFFYGCTGPSTEQVIENVADAVDLPLGIYNNPPRVKTDLHWDQLLRLFRHPNIVIHKESTARVGQMAQILAAAPDVSVMCCDSPNLGLVVPTMALGGHGTANMGGNIAPAEMAAISTPWASANEAGTFREEYLALLPLLHFNYSAINPVAIKSLMRACGLPVGGFRKPLRELGDAELEVGLRIIRNIGLAEKYHYSLG